MNLVETIVGVNRDARTPFERWVEDDLKLEIVRGYGAGPLGTLAARPWPQWNLDAVALWGLALILQSRNCLRNEERRPILMPRA